MICNPAIPVCKTKPYFTFTLKFSFLENKVAGKKMQLTQQFAWCPAAVECPANVTI